MSKKDQIRAILSDFQPHTAEELIVITHRFSAVISKLREDGQLIDTLPIAHNKFLYQMRLEGGQTNKAA
jgi:hypothetical protein